MAAAYLVKARRMSNRSAGHQALVNQCLRALSSAGVLCWDHPTGYGITPAGSHVRFGLPGSPDIIAVVGPNGRFLGVECKTGGATASKRQKLFREALTRRGGVYVLVRHPDDALAAVEHIRSAPVILIPIKDNAA
jgi:hypothetical protein